MEYPFYSRSAGVSPVDAPMLAVCAAIMLGIGAAAVTFPALRACRIDPLLALRHEGSAG